MFAGLFSSNKAKDNAIGGQSVSPRRLSTTAASKPPLIANKPPFPHPLPHTKIEVICSTDGLILSGHRDSRSSSTGPCALIAYGTAAATSLIDDYDPSADTRATSCVAYGSLGVFKLFQETYLLLITSKRHVGSYPGKVPRRISCLTGIAAIPLSTPAKAREAVRKVTDQNTKLRRRSSSSSSSESSDASSTTDASTDSDDSRGEVTVNLSAVASPPEDVSQASPDKINNAMTEAMEEQATSQKQDEVETASPSADTEGAAGYGLGRFFWSGSQQTSSDHSNDLVDWSGKASTPQAIVGEVDLASVTAAIPHQSATGMDNTNPTSSQTQAEAERLRSLDKKILRELTAEFTSGGFFYSQDYDLTTCTQSKWETLKMEMERTRRPKDVRHSSRSSSTEDEGALPDILSDDPRASEALSQRADRRFWYNRWLSKDFVEAGADAFVTVLVQGYAQKARVRLIPLMGSQAATGTSPDGSNDVKPLKLDLLILSRRSIERPGLRYQRRGVNHTGGVANFVETEFILCTHLEGKDHLTSYIQTRGSMPLYWSQSPWSLKPVPILERSDADNEAAVRKHFEKQIKLYFGPVHAVNLAETTGKEGVIVGAYRSRMAQLGRKDAIYNEWDFHHMCKGMRYERISLLLEQLDKQISEIGSFWCMGRHNLALQNGVFRTNCMDCLDRTNVVQSAFARQYLTATLEHLGIHDMEPTSREALDVAFNETWANNGDAISREYAGTSALKGDFVRSGKRNWLGQFNDATNSVARFWQNTILDFFKQAMIDYVTGVNTNAFLDFSEKMQTSDPGEITRLASIRQSAIDSSVAAVLADDEKKLEGWTLLSPATLGHLRDAVFEEKVLLLTAKALYICSYEYTLGKVRDFVRIPLGQITGIRQGEYILSALDPTARNTEENYGFCIKYLREGLEERSRTYSVRNTVTPSSTPAEADTSTTSNTDEQEVAFKAVRKDFVRDLEQVSSPVTVTSRVQVLDIVDHIRHACEDIGATTPDDEAFVTESPIISLAEAKAQVGLLDKINYGFKNLIWL